MMRLRLSAAAIALALTASGGFAADIAIPRLELMTWGRVEDESFVLHSRSYLNLLVEGGYKFAGRVEFRFDDRDLGGKRELPPTYDAVALTQALERNLLFKSVTVEIKELFGTGVNLAYFVGETDVFASGDEYTRLFGTAPFATEFAGYPYFPEGTLYEGLYEVAGTGVKIYAPRVGDQVSLAAYTYQDSRLGAGRYSSDLRFIFNSDNLKIESFLGSSYPVSDYGVYRIGLLFYYSTGEAGEFFTQIGIPRFDPAHDGRLDIDLFYFLFEPRIRFDLVSITTTVFWRPEYYRQLPTGEVGNLDLNLDFRYGSLEATGGLGGVENRLSLDANAGDRIRFRLSPYFRINISGVVWDFKLHFNLFPYSLTELVETFIGMRTEF